MTQTLLSKATTVPFARGLGPAIHDFATSLDQAIRFDPQHSAPATRRDVSWQT
jgi:hypothetical protein